MSIIDSTYVINLKNRKDRWENINKDFEGTSLKLLRWDAVLGKRLGDQEIHNLTSSRCYNLCSPSMIGCWLSHYSLWKHIVKNCRYKDNILILEDDSYPVVKGKEFQQMLSKVWTEVPKDYDIVYLGCSGTCEESILKDFLYLNPKNMNRQISKHVIIPGFPLLTHAYILSYTGAKKLIKSKLFDKIDYHLDIFIAKKVVKDKNFKIYAITPSLIVQNPNSQYSDNQGKAHPIFSSLASKIKIGDTHTLDSVANAQIYYIRKLEIPLTGLNLSIFLISYLIGFFGSETIKNRYLIILAVYYFIEACNGKINKDIFMELAVAYMFTWIGGKTKKYLHK